MESKKNNERSTLTKIDFEIIKVCRYFHEMVKYSSTCFFFPHFDVKQPTSLDIDA